MLKKKKDIEEQVSIAMGVNAHTISKIEYEHTDQYLYYEAQRNFRGIVEYTIDVWLSPQVTLKMTIPNIFGVKISEKNQFITNENIILKDRDALLLAIDKFLEINYPKAFFPFRRKIHIWGDITNKEDPDYILDYPLVFDKRDFKYYKNVRFVFLWNSKFKQPKLLKNPYYIKK